MNIYKKTSSYIDKGIPIVVVSVVQKQGEGPVEIGKKMIVTGNNEAHGTVGGGALEYEAREYCKSIFKSKQSITKTYLLQEGKILPNTETLPMACGGQVTLFFEYIGPSEYVYIFGAGHVGQALTTILKTMNFHVTVIDERQEVINQFVGGDTVVHKPFAAYIEEEGLIENSFVVVCTPSHKYDYNVINQVLRQQIKLKYIGMLCSVQKLIDYVDKTYEEFSTDIDLSNFYSPIGLDIGGGSPEEIAISITSEILAVSHQKKVINICGSWFNMIHIVTGKINSGKSSTLLKIYQELGQGDGFISVKRMHYDKVHGYDLLRLSDLSTRAFVSHELFATDAQREIACQIGPYRFYQDVLDDMKEQLHNSISNDVSPIFLDEIGMLELHQKCFASMLQEVIAKDIECYITVREDLINDVIDAFSIHDYDIRHV